MSSTSVSPAPLIIHPHTPLSLSPSAPFPFPFPPHTPDPDSPTPSIAPSQQYVAPCFFPAPYPPPPPHSPLHKCCCDLSDYTHTKVPAKNKRSATFFDAFFCLPLPSLFSVFCTQSLIPTLLMSIPHLTYNLLSQPPFPPSPPLQDRTHCLSQLFSTHHPFTLSPSSHLTPPPFLETT